MVFASVYDANGINIDDYYYCGRSTTLKADYYSTLDANKVFLDVGIDARLGPAINDGGDIQAYYTHFNLGLYLKKDKIKHLNENSISLREAINRLEVILNSKPE